MKSEQEIRERIQVWEEMIADFNKNNPGEADIGNIRARASLLPAAAKIFCLKWVLDEGPDI